MRIRYHRFLCESCGRDFNTRLPESSLPGGYDYPVIPQHKVHLTSKPVQLIKDLLAITPESGTILDPFLGGGTTALAAVETGRKCIGVALSNEYTSLALERIKTACQNK